jgi:hypothetical protein
MTGPPETPNLAAALRASLAPEQRILNRLQHVRNPVTTAYLHRTTGTGYTRSGFRKLLERMETAGLITRTEPGRRGRAVWWTLP